MTKGFRWLVFILLAFSGIVSAQEALPVPKYVPPDIETAGEEAYYRDLAIIETSCTDWKEVRALWKQLTEKGALIAVISSPQRWLGWVPREALDAVRSTSLNAALGTVAVRSVSYHADEVPSARGGAYFSRSPEVAEAEEALVDYLTFVKRTKTPEELRRIEERARELEYLSTIVEQPPCLGPELRVPQDPSGKYGTQGGPGPTVARRTKPEGLVVHSSFFVESASGTGSWNWDMTVYNRYRNLHLDAMTYWTGLASKYGKSMTTIWLNYSPNHWAMQISGEPVSVGENVFIPAIVNNLRPPSVWDILTGDLPLGWQSSGFPLGPIYGWYYNNEVRDAHDADQSIFVCIAYKGTEGEGIWPHASVIQWGNGDREGIYAALDVRYWQAGLNPYEAPMRNVIAHEVGHLWGAPDEYRNDNCSDTYRGVANLNCQSEQSADAYGRPGLKMHGFDAMMVGNYLGGTSTAMPVHVGLLSASNITPLRCISTSPANGEFTIKTCDNSSYGKATRTWSKTMCIPLEYDHCNRVTVPLTRNISGTTWYFDYWEVKRKSGTTTNIMWAGTELSSYEYTSTQSDPVVDIKAVYTNSPPDVFAVNHTLQAHLAPADNSASPAPAIALRWLNKYDMDRTETKIEREVSPGNWMEIDPILSPNRVGINQWTGVLITHVRNSLGVIVPVMPGVTYRFRIVGYFNTVRGTPSDVAEITTRPASPADTVYCADSYEPNSSTSPKTLPSSGSGMAAYSIKAACPISPRPGEWSWYVPKSDYYRITVINLSSGVFGEHLSLLLQVREGSNFQPRFRARRAGETTYINAVAQGAGRYKLKLTTDGEYIVSVEPVISSDYISYYLVEPSDGHFGFGEYTIDVERKLNTATIAHCDECIKLALIQPLNGLLISKIPGTAFQEGLDRRVPRMFDLRYDPPAGFSFDGWDLPRSGILENPNENPTRILINSNIPAGEYEIGVKMKPVDPQFAELVIIYPHGPDGTFSERTLHPIGSVVNIQAINSATYLFAGWENDTSTTTNPLAVTMWRSKKIIAVWKEKPCIPEPMTKWGHTIDFVNSRQGRVQLDYGMEEGAGDGLEPGQVDLPPFPPAATFDVRWINISGSNGSPTDIRAIKDSHTYFARVQTGVGTAPVQVTWPPPPTTPNASFTMYVQGDTTPVDMRATSSYTLIHEAVYLLRIVVKAPTCPERTQDPEVVVIPVRDTPSRFPCFEFGLQFRDRKTNELYPLYNPYQCRLFEKSKSGEWRPANVSQMLQLPNMLLYRLCTDPDDPDEDREIVVVNDQQEENTRKDTISVHVRIPLPTGNNRGVLFVQQHTGDWELISLPLEIADPSTSTIFSDPLTSLYGFDQSTGNYVSVPEMIFGDGYWLRTSDKQTSYFGVEKLVFEWKSLSGIGEPYGWGWNLIGCISRPIPVAGIHQNPAGGMRAIFGYNPAQGYVVPSMVEPGKGYWVRVERGTELRMESIGGVREPGADIAYVKTAASMNVVGTLNISDGFSVRSLAVTSSRMSPEDIDRLQIPAPPPGNSLDARTEGGTLYIPMDGAAVDIRAEGEVVLSFEPKIAFPQKYIVTDEQSVVLAEFTSASPGTVRLPCAGTCRVFIKPEGGYSPVPFALDQNYPNPFAPGRDVGTVIAFSLPVPDRVRLDVYDIMGRRVRTLLDADLPAGTRHVRWDGCDGTGKFLPAGTYVLRLHATAGMLTRVVNIVSYR
ncbi:MAG: FlgD immunoglobulin-like domain containing protein [Bacteroidota bacterium]|nr:FlgD immunoglobulin-like domain containing protein [Bacteroidota bacterium]